MISLTMRCVRCIQCAFIDERKFKKAVQSQSHSGRQWLGIYSIFRFEWLLLFAVAVQWRGRSSGRRRRRCQLNGFNANIQIRQCSPKKEAPFLHFAALHLEFMICFFQIVSISFRKRKIIYAKSDRLDWMKREQLFRFDLNILPFNCAKE